MLSLLEATSATATAPLCCPRETTRPWSRLRAAFSAAFDSCMLQFCPQIRFPSREVILAVRTVSHALLERQFLFITLMAKPRQTTQPHSDKAEGSSTIIPHPSLITAAPCSGRGQRGSQRCHSLFPPPRHPARAVAACAALLFWLLLVGKLHFFLHRSAPKLMLGFCF